MSPISFSEFNKIYLNNLKSISNFISDKIQTQLGKHNYGWRRGNTSFENYLKLSVKRYYIAYKQFYNKGNIFCDVGGFWGVFPLTLKDIGFNVFMTETLKYYDNAFHNFFNYLTGRGITIIDADPFEKNFNINYKFDIVSVMAVLEHYPHSPQIFFNNVLKLLNKQGCLYIEVPNILYYYKRKNMLFGKTPLTHISEIYNSEVPFIGHHHEYSLDELIFLADKNNLSIIKINYYTYSYNFGLKYIIKNPLAWLSQLLFKNTREVISINCTFK